MREKLINFLVGMANIKLFPANKRKIAFDLPKHTDLEALTSDWHAVGNDMREVINQINKKKH